MRLLTLNTHSIIEKNYDEKCEIFTKGILKFQPDIIAMQEVNQSVTAKSAGIPNNSMIKEDNHALKITRMLEENNLKYYFTWMIIKNGYDRFDEGLSFLSKTPIENVDFVTLSNTDDYNNWKTRKALVINTSGACFCNTHMGWWNDLEDPFKNQFDKLNSYLSNKSKVFLLGDFNSPSDAKNEGYHYICSKGWKDTYSLAAEKDNGYTSEGKIAGWEHSDLKFRRIDYIFIKHSENVLKSQVVFNGINEDVVSDHYGVMIDLE